MATGPYKSLPWCAARHLTFVVPKVSVRKNLFPWHVLGFSPQDHPLGLKSSSVDTTCWMIGIMKGCLVLFALLAVALAADKYPSKYDTVDVDSILQNGRVLTNYIKCMLEQGPCTKEGQELKKILPDALATSCSKCNEKQKSVAEKVINHLQKHRARDWDRLLQKYDPQGAYKKRYEESQQAEKKH